MKKNTILVVIIAILSLVIGGMATYIYLDKNETPKPTIDETDNVKSEQKINEEKYSYEDMTGVYTYESTFNSSSPDNSEINTEDIYFILYLWEDGTFWYDRHFIIEGGPLGNYYFKDDYIILNPWFYTGTGVGLTLGENEYSQSLKFKIDENKNIIDNSNHIINIQNQSATLKKETNTNEYPIFSQGLKDLIKKNFNAQ